MNFLKKFTESTETKTDTSDKSAPSDQTDLMSSAKLVADAARSTFQNEPNKYDNAEVAGAAADLLDAAQTYGKLDINSGVGSYVEKAENYLHEYENSNSKTKPTSSEEPITDSAKPTSDELKHSSEDTPEEEAAKPTSEEPKPSSEYIQEKEAAAKSTTEEVPKPSAEPTEEEERSEPAKPAASGLGDYAKMAEGFLKKNSDGESAEGEKGAGDLLKMAGGFLK